MVRPYRGGRRRTTAAATRTGLTVALNAERAHLRPCVYNNYVHGKKNIYNNNNGKKKIVPVPRRRRPPAKR